MPGYGSIVEELKKRIASKPELAGWASFYVDLISIQSKVDVRASEAAARNSIPIERLEAGLPLIALEELQMDSAAFIQLRREICTIVSRYYPDLASRTDAICRRLGEGEKPGVQQTSVPAEARASGGEENELESTLLAFVNNQALRPFLRQYAIGFMPFIEQLAWYRPRCPICGGEPDFAALARTNGARTLLCSRCDAEWISRRSGCPFCASDETEEQKYLVSEDGVYRLLLCEGCKRYLKTIDLRGVADERLLPVERILTLSMDLTAREMGYSAMGSGNLASD